MLTTLFLSRLQFALTISFHILFPAFSIGLSTYLVIVEGLWLKTGRRVFYRSARFWSKILALTFGMGIISGLAMQFQIGTNWAGFSKVVGPVLGVLFTLEALTAFFVEATFLGVMLFGWHYVSEKLHYFATIMVFVGVSLSAFWILSANSWMQTPAGVKFVHNTFIVTSWSHVIANPSAVIRYIHMMLAAYLSTACVITAVSCLYLLKNKYQRFAITNMKFGLAIIALLIPLQVWMGDEVGFTMHQYQPVKTAAIEGNWQTQHGAPLILIADIDQKNQRNDFTIKIPYIASLLNTHHLDGKLIGLTSVKPADQPDVVITFYSFRIMVAMGLLMMVLSWISLLLLWRKRFYTAPWLQKLWVWCAPIGFIALLTGWYTAEAGRQPWVVYGLIKSSQGVSSVSEHSVLLGFIIILIVYGLIFGGGYMTYLIKTIKRGPHIKARKRLK